MRFGLLILVVLQAGAAARAEDGYELWLRYRPVSDAALLGHYRASLVEWIMEGDSPTLRVAGEEMQRGLRGLLGAEVPQAEQVARDGSLVVGVPSSSTLIAGLDLGADLRRAGAEGFVIRSSTIAGRRATVVAANTDAGVLYGVFHFLRLLQTGQRLQDLAIVEAPRIRHRMLNHWDNLDRTVERGYAGFSLCDWHKLPDYLDPRYSDYARANASLGINGAALTNVNADAWVLTPMYLEKAAALAEVFRPYAIRVFLTARFSAPVEIGGLKTADPADPSVADWWKPATPLTLEFQITKEYLGFATHLVYWEGRFRKVWKNPPIRWSTT